MNGIIVSVDYAGELSLTLPTVRRHLDRVLVVTDNNPAHTDADVARANDCEVYRTDAFYSHGRPFAKWEALEEGLSVLGRKGVLCVLDADIAWPKEIPPWTPEYGILYTPLRHMLADLSAVRRAGRLPDDDTWHSLPLHRQQHEHASYCQIYHADDPHLPVPPWYDPSWVHCGGADSFMQMRWPNCQKRRPPFHCLHLGESGANWYGRSTPRLDGTIHPDAAARRAANLAIWAERKRSGFTKEKLPPR